MKTELQYRAALHKVKAKNGIVQGKITKRRIELWAKLRPLISHADDRDVIEKALRAKNLTPRYW